jgi:uncharacterized DUF497 family protein
VLFEWSEAKRPATLRDRNLDFADADTFFDGRPVLHQPTPRGGEDRWKSTVRFDGAFYTVIWIWRDGAMRIISMRRSHAREERRYRETHGL